MSPTLILIAFLLLVFALQVFSFVKRYIKVPPNKILVVYGKISQSPDEKYIMHTRGSHFVWPVIQEYAFLDLGLKNLKLEVKAQDAHHASIFCRIDIEYKISPKAEIATKYIDLNGIENEDNFQKTIQHKVSPILKNMLLEQEKSVILANSEEIKNELEEKLKMEFENLGLELIAIGEVYVR